MASRATAEKWLTQLTNLPTAPGIEDEVVKWVTKWASRRPDLAATSDDVGNVFIGQKGRKKRPPVLAVAHMDHPAFVITGPDGSFEFRGGVDDAYFNEARIAVVSRLDGPVGRILEYDGSVGRGTARFEGDLVVGDIAMWRFSGSRNTKGLFRAPACDDLAGVAAALAALDIARSRPELRHFGVMLTRAEEVGLLGAIHAAKNQTIPTGSRLLSIETSRELPMARIGDGPIVRVGDSATTFDQSMTNLVSSALRSSGLDHQRKLMDGGVCEATAFGAYGYRATGLCLALGNWHNRGNLDDVESGQVDRAIPMLEEISIADFHGLVAVLIEATRAVDDDDPIPRALDEVYDSNRHVLG